MADFMVHELAWYPWLAWVVAFLAVVGVVYGCLWVAGLVTFVSSWMAHKREAWRYKDAVMRELREDDDPPEYQHPEEDGDVFDWDGPPDDWSPVDSWGPGAVVRHDMADLATILARAHELGLLDDDQLPDGPPAERQGPPVCEDPECDKYGWVHPPPCVLVWTLPVPKWTEGPAMPPQPWSGVEQALPLLPAVRADLEAAGFGGHEYVEDVAESAFTKAQALEVQARMRELER